MRRAGNPRNILHISRTMGYGGAERVVLQLCRETRGRFDRVVVCSCGGALEGELEALCVRHVRIPDIDRKNPLLMVWTLVRLARVVRRERIGVVHTHHRMAAFYARLLCPFFGIRRAYTAHNVFYDRRALTRFALGGCWIAAVSACVADNLRDVYGVGAGRVIRNAVEPHPEGGPAAPLPARDGRLLVGAVGRLSAQKGVAFFLRAIPLMECADRCLFLIAGDGEERPKLEALADGLGVRERVRFLGYRADARAVIGQMDIVALPSLWEGSSLVSMEAFAAGRPVVASAVGGVPEIVRDGENGLLVPPGDARALAEALDRLAGDGELRARMGRRALEVQRAEFSMDRFRAEYAAFYRSLAFGDGPPAIVTPGVLPVPATRGGAVEALVELLLIRNEAEFRREIVVVTIDDPSARARAGRYPHVRFLYVRLPAWVERLYRAGILPTRARGLLFAGRAGRLLARAEHGSVLVENEFWFGRLLRRRAPGGLFLRLHNDYVGPPRLPARFWMRPYDRVLAVSDFLGGRVRAVLPDCPVEVVYNGVDDAFFARATAAERDARRAALGFSPGDVVVLFAGRLVPEKGVGELIEAFAQAARTCAALRLLVAGASFFQGSPETAYIESLRARCAGMDARVRFTGYVAHERMPALLSSCDIGCVPSLCEEAFGMAAGEQMAAGLPLVVSDAGALPELTDAFCAVAARRGAGFVEELAEAIARLGRDGALRVRMGEAARARAKKMFSAEGYGAATLKALGEPGDGNG